MLFSFTENCKNYRFYNVFWGSWGVRRPSGGRPAALRRSPFEKQKIEKTTGFIRFSLFCAPEVFTCFLLFLKRENTITSRNAERIGDRHLYTNKVFCCSRARLFHICSVIFAWGGTQIHRETSNGLAIGIYMKYEVLCVLRLRHSTYFLWFSQGKPQIHRETSSGFAIGIYIETRKYWNPKSAETQIHRETSSGLALWEIRESVKNVLVKALSEWDLGGSLLARFGTLFVAFGGWSCFQTR